MRAVVVPEAGGVELRTVADPEPRDGEVVVQIVAAAINRRDLRIVEPESRWSFPRPFVLGSDGAGIRTDTGEEVIICPSLAWGEDQSAPEPDWRILGGPDDGTFAELVSVPAENLFPRPPGFSWQEAAALPLAGLTAYRALFPVGGLREGETVLVLGAGSGVSTLAVPLAAQAGARVIVTSSSDEKIARARSLGADAGVNYASGEWVDEVRELTGGGGVDLVVDSVGATWMDSLRCLRRGGRMAVFGANGGAHVDVDVRFTFFNWLSILGTAMGSLADFAALLAMVERASWRPAVDSVRPLAETADAFARIEAQAHFGKLVLQVR
jgi:zinc-binding alcohol dehydrogenase/oxidoreductase